MNWRALTLTLIVGLLCWTTVQAEAPLVERALSVVRSDGVRVELVVEVARSEEQRQRGLMGRRSLAPRHGMLFDFEAPTIATMWMKDTPMSLDMLFVAEDGRVVWIGERTTPQSLTLISTPQLVRYVVELNGGEARELGLAVGDRVLVRCPAMNLRNSLALEPRCGVARRRNSPAVTPPRALPRGPMAARIIEVHHGTAH